MRVIDITLPLDENVAIYEGDPRYASEVWSSIEQDGYMLSKISMGTHTGTHVDAPCHFVRDGKSIRDLSIKRFVGRCVVLSDIDSFEGGYSRVLISSKKGGGRLTEQQAEELLEKRVRLVGTELLSIGNDRVHKILLGGDCLILEALCLEGVLEGEYVLSATPLKIDADGSPLRAVLIEPD